MPPELNPQQKAAVEAPDTPLLIVAGAGTGKTRTLTSRMLHLIRRGVPPERICALTFTNKAAREMNERVMAGLPANLRGSRSPFLGTFHSLGARILRVECKSLGRNSKFVIFDAQDSVQLVKKILKEIGARLDEKPSFILGRISALKNGMVTPADLAASRNPADKTALRAFERYEEELEKQNAFDFDDLLVKVVKIWREHPAVLEKYRRRYQYILVDEYQDLNNTQYELIRLLAEHHGRISVVGDDQQTIYSWRGSNFEIFMGFEKDWPNSTVVVLDQNYRSSGNIIRAASEMIAHNLRQKPKKLWTEHPEGELVHIVETGTEDDEALWVANHIAEDPDTTDRTTAVLYRTNAQSRAIEQALIERGIPYLVFGGLKFYERREVKDIVAALRFITNPRDEASRERLEKTFKKRGFANFIAAAQGHENDAPGELAAYIVKHTGYFEYLDKNFTNAAERKENIAELVRFAAGFTETTELLEQVTLLQATDTLRNAVPEKGLPVHLMTIHLAKGLEFDRVFVVGVAEGLMPHAWSIETEKELEEERRLMYVAMTRARQELFLTFYDLPSRFLSEIPPELTEYESLISDDKFFEDNEERYISWD